MKLTREFLRALMTGGAKLQNVQDNKGWVELDAIAFSFADQQVTIDMFAPKNLHVATIKTKFDPTSGGMLYLTASQGFKMDIEVELSE